MDTDKKEWFGEFYKWFAYLLAASFIVIGGGILLKLLLPDPFPLTSVQRWVIGGFIMAYGIGRIIWIYLRDKKTRKANITLSDD